MRNNAKQCETFFANRSINTTMIRKVTFTVTRPQALVHQVGDPGKKKKNLKLWKSSFPSILSGLINARAAYKRGRKLPGFPGVLTPRPITRLMR